jgi:thiamine biosynthesis protein ThiI
MPGTMKNCILIHYGEISLKGKNQPQFRKQLTRNISMSMKSIGIDWPLRQYRGYLSLDAVQSDKLNQAGERLSQVLGISWYAPASRYEFNGFGREEIDNILEVMRRQLCTLAREHYRKDASFRVVVRRAEKRFPANSVELERDLGAQILKNSDWKYVDLKNPDISFNIEIQNGEIFIHTEKIKGAGGLPVNSAQKVLVMLSGGIDSPVAAYLTARRGCHIDFVHFTASHVKSDEIENGKIGELARKLSESTLSSKLYILPSTYFDLAIAGKPADFQLILFRRFMARAAERLAGWISVHALVTGDNLSQVASQTLTNIASTTRAIALPVLQPLIAYEKEDIINVAIRIGTYETSIQSYKDCCSLFQRNPRTMSYHQELTMLEYKLFDDYDTMLNRTLSDKYYIEYRHGKKKMTTMKGGGSR